MKEIFLNPNDIPQILAQNLPDQNTIFVFSTDTVMNSWIDWIVLNPQISGTDAVPFERFTAWDNFKREYLSISQDGLTAVPTLLRKLFVADLIHKNSLKPKEERFQVIINPDDEFAKNADTFSSWISDNLTSLHFWKSRYEKNKSEYGEMDSEDKDYDFIYNEYSNFLKSNNLFEPSWIENTDIIQGDKKFIIFYPEMLQDFQDFTETFEKSDNITLCKLPHNLPSPKAYLYPDSRTELRQTMLQIINLVKENKADWSEIALSIPDIETYRPYIEREFDLYGIPYVIKSGIKLTQNTAGRIFREIYNCYNENFTFDSVRSLLLDECVPWKEEYIQLKEDLIREGNRMRCICSPYEKDIWLSTFTSKINRLEKTDNPTKNVELNYFNNLKDFYLKLKTDIKQFFTEENKTFANILKAWMQFKSNFLQDDKNFSEEANNILSRCITELEEIIKIENDFSDCKLFINSPFDFYLQMLDEKTYTPQTKKTGVQIFKYKLSAAAHFKYQFVIDGSQKNLEVVNKRLTFFNATKRSKLHLLEDDKNLNATEVFMKLYARSIPNGADDSLVHFSAATETFSGFAIPHSLLEYKKDNLPNLDSDDYIKNEMNFIRNSGNYQISEITENQRQMFNNWKNHSLSNDNSYSTNDNLNKIMDSRIGDNGKIDISARSDLEKFFPCPRKWVLQTLLHLKEDSLDTDLMKGYDMGNLNHKILELILSEYMNKKLPFFDKEKEIFINSDDGSDCTQDFINLIEKSVEKGIVSIPDIRDSLLVIQTLQSQTNAITTTIINFLKLFLINFEQNGFGMCKVLGMEVDNKLEMENFNYKGRIDCILETPSFDLVIIDFKNSKSSIPDMKSLFVNEDGLLGDFQMSVYYKLVSNNGKKEIFSLDYYSITDASKTSVVDPHKSTKSKALTSFEDYNPTLKVTDEYANEFSKIIKEKVFIPQQSYNPKDRLNVKNYEHCSQCNFNSICRTTYTVASKNISSGDNK